MSTIKDYRAMLLSGFNFCLPEISSSQGSVGAPVHSWMPECAGGHPESSFTGQQQKSPFICMLFFRYCIILYFYNVCESQGCGQIRICFFKYTKTDICICI